MTDLLHVLADFPTASFSHLIPSLDKAHVSTSDLLTLDAADIAKRAQLPPSEVAKLAEAVLQALQTNINGLESNTTRHDEEDASESALPGLRAWQTISTLDDTLDTTLGGGVPTGYMTEITGER